MDLKDIESLSDADKLALVKSIQESVAANKAKQVSLEAGQYAKLVVDAVKKIKTDLEDRYAAISQDIAAKSASIKDGKDGLQGPKGEKGDRGFDGVNGKDGRDGKDGKDGVDGSDGVGVSDAHIDFDGALVITLTDGREINAGEVVPLDVAEKIKVIGNGGGTSQYVLDTLASLQTQINNLSASGGLAYQGTWNASTNTPTLTSSSGTTNYYYVVSVAGATNLNGITDWQPGDWAIYNGTAWQKIDQTNSVTSVNGQQGAVVLSTTDVSEGTNQYFTNARARGAVSAAGSLSYNSTTGVFSYTTPSTTGITEGTNLYYTDARVRAAISAGTGISYNSATGAISSTITQYTDALARASISAGTGISYNNTTGVVTCTITQYTDANAKAALSAGTGISYNSTTGVITSTITQYTDANAKAALSAGTGISYNSTTGVITNSSPNQTVAITGSGTTSVTGTYPNFTVSSADQYTGTVTSVAALTLGTTGTDVSSTVATGTTTPVITLNIPTASATNRGALSSTDWSTFNGKQAALVSGTNIKTVNSNSLLGSGNISVGTVTSVGGTGTVNGLTLTGTVTSSGNLTLGGTLDLSSPPAIGGTTPSTGAFTTLKVGSSSILGNANADVTLGLAVRNSGASMGYLQTYNGNAGADLKTWRFGGNGSGNLVFETVNDAYSSSTNRMTLDSSGNLTANSFNTANFTVVQSGTKLLFKYNGTTIASMDSTGIITSATNIVSNGTP